MLALVFKLNTATTGNLYCTSQTERKWTCLMNKKRVYLSECFIAASNTIRNWAREVWYAVFISAMILATSNMTAARRAIGRYPSRDWRIEFSMPRARVWLQAKKEISRRTNTWQKIALKQLAKIKLLNNMENRNNLNSFLVYVVFPAFNVEFEIVFRFLPPTCWQCGYFSWVIYKASAYRVCLLYFKLHQF